MYRHATFYSFSTFVGLALFAVTAVPRAAVAQNENMILLRVNDSIATEYDYQTRLAERMRAINNAPDLEPERREKLLAEASKMSLGSIFNELLISSRAKQLGIAVTDFEVDEAINQMRQANGLEDDRTFQGALQQEGMAYEDLRDQYRREQERMAVLQREVRARIELGEDDLRRIFRDNPEDYRVPERRKVQEVVVLEGAGAEERANTISQQLETGESFDKVREVWGDLVSNVLDIGWVTAGDLDPALETVAFELAPGEISEPVLARGGWHIVRLEELEESKVQDFEEVRELIQRAEYNRQMGREFDLYVRELEEDAYVVCKTMPGTEQFCQDKLAGRKTEVADDGPLGLDDVDRIFAPGSDGSQPPAVPAEDASPEDASDTETAPGEGTQGAQVEEEA